MIFYTTNITDVLMIIVKIHISTFIVEDAGDQAVIYIIIGR